MIYDWFPTLLEAAGEEIGVHPSDAKGGGPAEADAPSFDGLDLKPLLLGQNSATFDRPLVWHFPYHEPSVAPRADKEHFGPSRRAR